MAADRPDILFPPPLGFAAAVVLTAVLARWAPLGLWPPVPWPLGLVAAAAIIAFALYTNISGFLAFRRAKTNVNPYKPALTVVRDGAFRYTRNPMYLGMILFVLGLGLLLSTLWGAIFAGALWAALHYWVVLREERYMAAKFPDAYRSFIAQTRRWL